MNKYIASVEVDGQKVADQIVTAFEGGVNYWCHGADLVSSEVKPTESPWYSCPKLWEGDFAILVKYDDPDKEEGNASGRKEINQDDIKRGIQMMAEKSPAHFTDLIMDDGDAITADVFFQYVVLGDVIYG